MERKEQNRIKVKLEFSDVSLYKKVASTLRDNFFVIESPVLDNDREPFDYHALITLCEYPKPRMGWSEEDEEDEIITLR